MPQTRYSPFVHLLFSPIHSDKSGLGNVPGSV
jgi:hypothetical protein